MVERSELSASELREAVLSLLRKEESAAVLARRHGVSEPTQHTAATNSELAPVLGVGRPGRVPNLTRRYRAWLGADSPARTELRRLEKLLDETAAGQQTWNSV
jgi:hypothetical protein